VAYIAAFVENTGKKSAIFKTIDGGNKWNTIETDSSSVSAIYSLAMRDEAVGVAGGVAGSGMYLKLSGNKLNTSRSQLFTFHLEY
jgi:photosystem II stability/assembly factor-like uncharacterized protein